MLSCILGDLYLQKTRFASHVKMINLNIYALEDIRVADFMERLYLLDSSSGNSFLIILSKSSNMKILTVPVSREEVQSVTMNTLKISKQLWSLSPLFPFFKSDLW